MDVTPLVAEGQQVIRSYAPGRFVISGISYHHAAIVFPDQVVRWSFSGQAESLSILDFALFMSYPPLPQPSPHGGEGVRRTGEGVTCNVDILLVGCGALSAFLPKLKAELKAVGINADFMDTGAACRTYNVLMAEGRRVAAALIPL